MGTRDHVGFAPEAAFAPRARGGTAALGTAVVAFALSGAAGVMHEVAWARQLVNLIGAAAYAEAAVLAVFMAGLALGAVLVGHRIDRHGRPLYTYVCLEAAVALWGLLFPVLLVVFAPMYLALARLTFDAPVATILLRVALAAITVGPPAVLLGGTLPALVRGLSDCGRAGGAVARLYAWNTGGAVAGVGIAGFGFLPHLGWIGTMAAAAVGNGVAALMVWPAARREPPHAKAASAGVSGAVSATSAIASRSSASRVKTIAVAAGLVLAGFAAMGHETLFIRIIGLSFGASTYAFTIMLALFVAALALGSAVAARCSASRLWWLLGFGPVVAAALFLAVTPLLARLPWWIDLLRVRARPLPGGFELLHVGAAVVTFAVIVLPVATLGLAFPLGARIWAEAAEPGASGGAITGRSRSGGAGTAGRVGWAYFCNAVGDVLGVVVTAFVVLPRLGLGRSYGVLCAVTLAAGLAFLIGAGAHVVASPGQAGGRRRREIAFAAAGCLACATAVALPLVGSGWSRTLTLVPNHMFLGEPTADGAPAPPESFAEWRRRFLLPEKDPPVGQTLIEEDAHSTVVAFTPRTGVVALAVNNKVDASVIGRGAAPGPATQGAAAGSDLETQLLLAHVPMMLAPRARSVLIVGHGAGITTQSVLRYFPETTDLVEISPAVLRADRLFAPFNNHVLAGERVRVTVDDAFSFMRATPRKYDVVVSQPSNPWVAGAADLFTTDFLAEVRAKLNPGGVFVYWFHTDGQSDQAVQLMLRTLSEVFPHALLFFDRAFGNVIAAATVDPPNVDFTYMEQRFAKPPVYFDLRRIGLPNLVALLSHQGVVADRDGARAQAIFGHGPVNTFDRQRLQYLAARSLFAGTDSYLLEQASAFLTEFDPATLAGPPGAVLIDRYIAYRNRVGRPLPVQDFVTAAAYAEAGGGYGPQIARALRARAAALAEVARQPAP